MASLPTGPARRPWWRPLGTASVFYGCLSIVVLVSCNHLIFQPPAINYSADDSHIVMLEGEERLACFWLPPPDGNAALLLWSHGNAEDLGHLGPLFTELHGRGFGILAYDYPGYGASEGTPDESACYAAASRAWDFATTQQGIRPERILLVGQSVGSGPATWLAKREDAAGLVLISPFLSAFRTLTRIPLFPGDKFSNISRISDVGLPLLVIHGTRDEVIPFSHGRTLHDRHPGPKRFVAIEDAGHNTIWRVGLEEIVDAIQRLGGTPRQKPTG
jgi:pimeloyl-ACP methyl ester carboxylesterase